MKKDELCFSLMRFVLEAIKRNADPYPAETLYKLVISLQIHLSLKGREILFLQDREFVVLTNTLDTRMKQLSSQGIRVRSKTKSSVEQMKKPSGSLCQERTPLKKLLDIVIWITFPSLDYILPYKLTRNLRYEPNVLPVDSDLRIYGKCFVLCYTFFRNATVDS